MDRYQVFTSVLTKISREYPTLFHDKDRLLALFIDLSPKSKAEIKALRGFVVNDCNKTIEALKGENISLSTKKIIEQIRLICGNPEIEPEASVALCQAYADIVGVKYDRNKIQQQFGSSGVITTGSIRPSPSGISKTPQSNASASTPANVSHDPPPTPKPNKTMIVVLIIVIAIVLGGLCYLLFDYNPKSPISEDSSAKHNVNSTVVDSEDRLQQLLSEATTSEVIDWIYDDFDNNGIFEAFASIDENADGQHLWYISLQGAVKIETGSSGAISKTVSSKGRKFIVWKNEFSNSNASSTCYGVKNGQYYNPGLYGTDIVQESNSGKIYRASPIFTYDGDYIQYTLCEFDETTLEFSETEEYYTEKAE